MRSAQRSLPRARHVQVAIPNRAFIDVVFLIVVIFLRLLVTDADLAIDLTIIVVKRLEVVVIVHLAVLTGDPHHAMSLAVSKKPLHATSKIALVIRL